MHSTWAAPTWREGDILHPVQVAKEGRTCGGGRELGDREGDGGHCLDNRHPQRKEGEGGSDDQLLHT